MTVQSNANFGGRAGARLNHHAGRHNEPQPFPATRALTHHIFGHLGEIPPD